MPSQHVLTALLLLVLVLLQVKSDAAGPQFDQAAMDAVEQAGMEVSAGTAAAAEDRTWRQAVRKRIVCGSMSVHARALLCVSCGCSVVLPFNCVCCHLSIRQMH
jgi:hypothetical protein